MREGRAARIALAAAALALLGLCLLGILQLCRPPDDDELLAKDVPGRVLPALEPPAGEASAPDFRTIGRDACAGCHPQEYARWQGSHHDLARSPAYRILRPSFSARTVMSIEHSLSTTNGVAEISTTILREISPLST